MAQNKKKVIVYADWIGNFEDLTDLELGQLMRHFFHYINDKEPILEDRLLKIAWKPIESTLRRDLKLWEKKASNSRENGKLGGRPKNNPNEPKKPSGLINNPNEPKKPVSVSDSVNVSVIDNVNVNVKEDDDVIRSIKEIVIDYKKNERLINALLNSKEKLFLNQNEINNRLDEFVESLKLQDVTTKKELDFKKHFLNWVKVKKKAQQNNQSTSTLKQTTIEK